MVEPKQGDEVRNRPVKLYVPLDASHVDGFKPGQNVQVVVRDDAGALQSVMVQMDKGGKGSAEFSFKKTPGALTIAMGPENAAKEDIFGLQTINLSVSARQWLNNKELRLTPVIISDYYWHWWLRWCRTFTITGRVLCRDGNPVPGAVVTAYDVDAWWWWMSRQKVGNSVVTDVNGAFKITFKWCCGWWPWWWWRLRHWELEPHLAERIHRLFYEYPVFPRPPLPDPAPDLEIFRKYLGREEFASLKIGLQPSVDTLPQEMNFMGTANKGIHSIDPGILDTLREKLRNHIPDSIDLKRFRIWPWWKWQPWWDCTPDIIFRVTQNCHFSSVEDIIVDESYFDARWDIPTSLHVTLVANEKACCVPKQKPPLEGNCVTLYAVCHGIIANTIGGNAAIPTVPIGYYDPGGSDRPFAGTISIQGMVGNSAEYYSFEKSQDGGGNWSELDPAAAGPLVVHYYDGTFNYPSVDLRKIFGGKYVYETRQHYRDNHAWPWFFGWTDQDTLMSWNTGIPFENGEYWLRVKGWKLLAGVLVASNNTSNPDIPLPACGTNTVDTLKLRIDNRLVGLGSGHPPSVPDHPCGDGTVHFCTMEPDTDFLSVKIIRSNNPNHPETVDACGSHPIYKKSTDKLQIDFIVSDPEGHLSQFTLKATYKENLAIDLFNVVQCPSTALTSLTGAPDAADQVGPTYSKAILQGAPHPTWKGGAMRVEVDVNEVFPETCCYQLELTAYKRTIVDCWGGEAHWNLSEYSFMIQVLEPPI